jgi:hypothetical protein
VDVIPSSQSLSPIGRKYAKWELSERPRIAASVEAAPQVASPLPRRVEGWKRPLEEEHGAWEGLKLGMTLGGVFVAGYAAVLPFIRDEKVKRV